MTSMTVLRRAIRRPGLRRGAEHRGGPARPGPADRRHRRNPWPAAATRTGLRAIDDPEADRFARDLAAAMDERVSLLGNPGRDGPPGLGAAVPRRRARRPGRAGGLDPAGRRWSPPTAKNAATPTRPTPSGPRPNAPHRSSGPAGTPPTPRCGCRTSQRGSPPRATASCGPGGHAYARDTAWAPPYVAGELRDAHLAEDTYRADAVRAWHRADAAADVSRASTSPAGGRTLQRAGPGGRRLPRGPDRGRRSPAPMARRHRTGPASGRSPPTPNCADGTRTPNCRRCTSADEPSQAEPEAVQAEPSTEAEPGPLGPARAPSRARRAGRAGRGTKGRDGSWPNGSTKPTATPSRRGDDLMRRREAEAEEEAAARRSAVRQDPAPSRHRLSLDGTDELELEAGH